MPDGLFADEADYLGYLKKVLYFNKVVVEPLVRAGVDGGAGGGRGANSSEITLAKPPSRGRGGRGLIFGGKPHFCPKSTVLTQGSACPRCLGGPAGLV